MDTSGLPVCRRSTARSASRHENTKLSSKRKQFVTSIQCNICCPINLQRKVLICNDSVFASSANGHEGHCMWGYHIWMSVTLWRDAIFYSRYAYSRRPQTQFIRNFAFPRIAGDKSSLFVCLAGRFPRNNPVDGNHKTCRCESLKSCKRVAPVWYVENLLKHDVMAYVGAVGLSASYS